MAEDPQAVAAQGQGQVLLGDIEGHVFEGNRFWPWKCANCGGLFSDHREIADAAVERAVGALAAKDPEPNQVLVDGAWTLWIGNLESSSNTRGLNAWAGAEVGGAVVVAAEGLGDFFPKWAKAFAARQGADKPVRASLHLGLVDSPDETRLPEELRRAVAFIDEHRSEGRPVLVHCAQGKHRSAAIVVGYLMVREGIAFEAARDLVKARRPITDITPAFERSLLQCR